jgi:hypothetical protein
MHPATTLPATARGTDDAFEPIDVRRIRLMQGAGASAVVSEFRTADQVLDRWIGRGSGCPARREFTFEITFVDGYTFSGCYEFWRGARRRPSLGRFVRSMFSALAAPEGLGPVDLSRYAIDAA